MALFGKLKYLIILGLGLVFFLPPFAKYQELRYKNEKLAQDMKDLKAEIKRLQFDKKRLETDITYIEQRARDKLGVVRKDEIVIMEKDKK